MGSPDKTRPIQKQHKHKKQKKEKKEKKEKKHKRDRQQRNESPSPEPAREPPKYYQAPAVLQKKPEEEGFVEERTHVNCRRCKQPTFSLKARTCSNCGYPKQQRPKYFPVVKQVNVMDLVRQGKLVHNSYAPVLIEVTVNDRYGKKQRIKCCPSDSVFDFKKLISAQIGTRPEKIRLQKANIIFKDHISLEDYEIKDGTGLQMYYD